MLLHIVYAITIILLVLVYNCWLLKLFISIGTLWL